MSPWPTSNAIASSEREDALEQDRVQREEALEWDKLQKQETLE